MIRRLSVRLIGGFLLLLLMPSSVLAYNPANAAAYADGWWNSYNLGWPVYGSDCTNFVSQAVWSGGYPMDYSANNPWYAYYNAGWHTSLSWSIVQNNRGFYLTDLPGGYVVNSFYVVKTASISGVQGDIIYYAWYGDTSLATNSYEAIITVTNGRATSTADTGALVDAHTNPRYHEYWTLYYWNTDWWRTYYEVVHILPCN